MVDVSKLKEKMMKKCFTVRALAATSGVSESAINNILRQRTSPNISTIGKLAKALGIEPTDILSN